MANIYNQAVYSAAGEVNPAKNKKKKLDLCWKCLTKPHTSLGEVLNWEAAQMHTNICLQQLFFTPRGVTRNLCFPTCSTCHFFKSVYSILVERLKNLQASEPRSAGVLKVKTMLTCAKPKQRKISLFLLLWVSTQRMIVVMWK